MPKIYFTFINEDGTTEMVLVTKHNLDSIINLVKKAVEENSITDDMTRCEFDMNRQFRVSKYVEYIIHHAELSVQNMLNAERQLGRILEFYEAKSIMVDCLKYTALNMNVSELNIRGKIKNFLRLTPDEAFKLLYNFYASRGNNSEYFDSLARKTRLKYNRDDLEYIAYHKNKIVELLNS